MAKKNNSGYRMLRFKITKQSDIYAKINLEHF